MNKVIYDSAITGHHSEYISHVVDYLVNSTPNDKYFFVVNEELQIKFPEIVERSKGSLHIEWVFIPKEEIADIYKHGILKRSFVELKTVVKYAKKLSAQHVYLLYFNIFQLALGFIKPNFTISGILFLQFYRMTTTSLKQRLKYYRKYYTTRLYSSNSKITKIFILNDESTVGFLNNEFKTSKFHMLPDPIPQLSALDNFNIREYYKIEENKRIFLHIGSLGDRKGTFEIIESVKYLSKERLGQVCILLVGKTGNVETDRLVLNKIEQVQNETTAKVIWDNQFVSNSMMKSLFDQSDVVLMPYKNAEASSGILGHAMSSGTPVIATGSGLLKELILEHKAGLLIENVNAHFIANAIENIDLSMYEDKTSLESFVKQHHSERFAYLLLN